MIQHCLQCDRPMHLRGGDMTVFCAECMAKPPPYQLVKVEHPLPRSQPHDLDARALKVRNDELRACLADRDRLIAAFREKLQDAERRIEALDTPRLPLDTYSCRTTHSACECVLKRMAKLEAVAEAARAVMQMQCECDSKVRGYECCWMPSDAQPLLGETLAALDEHLPRAEGLGA